MIKALVKEWGGFLAVSLFIEAVIYLFGGDAKVMHTIDIISEGVVIGRQKVKMLSHDTGFEITGFTKGVDAYKNNS